MSDLTQVQQISIFIENKPGRLSNVTKTLKEANINIKALSLADTSDFGILRLIVDQYATALKVLKEKGFTVSTTNVVAVEVEHTPGGLDKLLDIVRDHDINIEYMYGFHFAGADAVMVFRFNKPEEAVRLLQKNNIRVLCNGDVCG